MKNFVKLTLVSLLLLQLSSCLPVTHPPIGIWESENPNIRVYVKSEYSHSQGFYYPAIYIVNGEETKVFARFDLGTEFTIFDLSEIREDGRINHNNWLYRGSFRLRRNVLYVSLGSIAQERTGFEQIIFNRLEEYDPINPQDWWVR